MIKSRDMQVFEILEAVSNLPKEQQAQELRKYQDHTPLQYILKWNFDESIVSVLPEGSPPHNSAEEDGPPQQSLWGALQLFPAFVKSGASAKMQMIQIEKQFIDLLEHLEPKEARVVVLAKDGELQEVYPIGVDVISEAFPDLISRPAQIVVEETPEQKAAKLMKLAEQKKEQAKRLNAEAKELTKEAKTLAGE